MNIIKYITLASIVFVGVNTYTMEKSHKDSSSSSHEDLTLSQERALKRIQTELWQEYNDKINEEALAIPEMSPRQRFMSNSYSQEKHTQIQKDIKRRSIKILAQREKLNN